MYDMNIARWLMAVCSSALLAPNPAQARGYPSTPIRFIIPYAPGEATDIIARLVSQKLTEAWGQPVLVESKPGANGIIASEAAAKAAADGNTIMLAVLSTHATNASLYSKLPYDPVRDFTPVVRERLATLNYEPVGSTPAELTTAIENDTVKWRRVVKESNYKAGE
ncbi:Bug family tripartite tricarboxylate transporter substrate binding protein [Piscinibacter sakaiensis]|uniref:Bug family tripartite tricarboxylate transporter substrate binding protein n=1 Tax=Piscinibacter sakaiensis TaxID=1547922 RepID=UPI003AABFEFD